MMKEKNNKSLPVVVGIIFALLIVVGFLGYLFEQMVVITPPLVSEPVTILTIAGSGSASFALQTLAPAFEKKYTGVKLEFLNSADAAVGYAGVKDKSISIGAVSRKANPEEEFPGMILTPFARDAVVFVLNKSAGAVTDLSAQELVGIYTGKIKNWSEVGGSNQPIVLIDREEAESSKKLFRQYYLEKGIVPNSAIELHSERDVLSSVLDTPGSIGYLSYGRASQEDVHIVSIDGKSAEKHADGSYKLVRIYYVVTTGESQKEVRDFINFLTEDGATLLTQNHYFAP